jgi:DME family drug/metabolite transporter
MTVHTAGSTRHGLILIGGAAIAWGLGGAVAAVLFRTSGLDPVAVSFWRFAVAVAALSALRVLRPTAVRAPTAWRRTVLIGAGLALSQTAYFGAVQAAGVALGTLVTIGAGPILIAIGARYALGERLNQHQLVAIGVGLAGLLLLVGSPGSIGPHGFLGVMLALLSAAGLSAVTLLTRAGGVNGATLPVFGVGMLCLLPFALYDRALPHGSQIVATAGWLLFLGTVPTLLAYRWFFAGLATVPATTASIIVLLEPVVATLIAVAVLGERLTVAATAGAVLLIGTVVLLARSNS